MLPLWWRFIYKIVDLVLYAPSGAMFWPNSMQDYLALAPPPPNLSQDLEPQGHTQGSGIGKVSVLFAIGEFRGG